MKVFLVIAALCVAGTLGGLSEEQAAKVQKSQEECISESGVDPALVQEGFKTGKLDGDQKLQCFAHCLLKKTGVLNAEGEFQEDVVRAKTPADIPQEDVDRTINDCKGLAGSDACESGTAVFQCFLKTKSFNLL